LFYQNIKLDFRFDDNSMKTGESGENPERSRRCVQDDTPSVSFVSLRVREPFHRLGFALKPVGCFSFFGKMSRKPARFERVGFIVFWKYS